MLNVDKNSRTIKTNPKSTENQTNHFISTWRKIKIYLTKTSTAVIVLENHSQTFQFFLKINHLIIQTTKDDHRAKKIYVIAHKTSIVDQIVEAISIETTIQDQFQADQNFRLKPVPAKNIGIDTIPMIHQETLYLIKIEIIPLMGIENIQMIETKDIKQ